MIPSLIIYINLYWSEYFFIVLCNYL